MPKRVSRDDVKLSGGNYFAAQSGTRFITSGCTMLDCVLGGGWPLGRFSNIVGDKSTGKTLLAIEAAANFAINYPKGKIFYRESEAAFDQEYAGALGLPLTRVNFSQPDTVEDVFEDLTEKIVKIGDKGVPGLYIVDSLDALTDRAAQKRKLDEGSYNLEKPKMMGKLFRELARDVEAVDMSVLIISQVRTKIGVMFGDKTTRSGGAAMDFYASQVLKLAHMGILKRKLRGTERATGVRIKAKTTKNKVGLPFRVCEFNINFGYGIDDVRASLAWLKEIGCLGKVGVRADGINDFLDQLERMNKADRRERETEIRDYVKTEWRAIDKEFLPKRRKYEVEA